MMTVSKNSSGIGVIPSDLKYSNRLSVLQQFRCGRSYTANEISDTLLLSRQTVMKNIQYFLKKGLLISAGEASSTSAGGKRPELFSLTDKLYLLCIELWPEEICLLLMDLRANTIDKFYLRQPVQQDLHVLLDAVGNLCIRFLEQNSISSEMLCGVCVSTPGIINYETNTVIFNALSPAWGTNLPIADMLRPYFDVRIPIIIENVGKLAGRAILHDTALLKQHQLNDKRFLTVLTTWGLSGCLIEKSRVLNGKHALIGEFGHMTLDANYPTRCGCGSCGCFQQLTSNQHIRLRVAALLAEYPSSMLQSFPAEAITVQTLFDLSDRNDPLARKLVRELAQTFSIALRNISLSFDQEYVVIQGIFANADAYFKQTLNEKLMDFHYYFGTSPFTIKYDTRPIYKLDQLGAYAYLLDYLSTTWAQLSDESE